MDEREELIAEGIDVPNIPYHQDQISNFSCRTGRYSSTAGDVIVFKVEPEDDDATITSDDFPDDSTHYDNFSTLSTEYSTINNGTNCVQVNVDHDNNYEILLQRKCDPKPITIKDHRVQTGK